VCALGVTLIWLLRCFTFVTPIVVGLLWQVLQG
jgi:hypothetical protein